MTTRPDLGPRLRCVLAEQRPLLHSIPVRGEIRRRFTPSDRSFLACDYTQLEARMLQLEACAPQRGGTRKIADLPLSRVCRHPHHSPPSMMVYSPGVYEHTCPGCHARTTFRVDQATL